MYMCKLIGVKIIQIKVPTHTEHNITQTGDMSKSMKDNHIEGL